MIRESEAKAKTEKLNIWSEENAVNTSLTSAKNIKTANTLLLPKINNALFF